MIVSFTGHRPDKLNCGYSITNERVVAYSDMLMSTLRDLIENKGARTFISGGAIGWDQIAFWTVQRLKNEYGDQFLRNIVSIPFKNQPIKWRNDELITWYNKMLQRADEVIYVDELQDYQGNPYVQTGHYSAQKMQLRNQHMVDASRCLVACWNGDRSGGTANCVKYAESQGKRIIRLEPLVF